MFQNTKKLTTSTNQPTTCKRKLHLIFHKQTKFSLNKTDKTIS